MARRSSASAWRCSRSPPRCSPIRRSPRASPTASSPIAATSGPTPIRTAPACCPSCSRRASAMSATSITRSTCRCTSSSATANISTPPARASAISSPAGCPALPGELPRLSDWTDHLSTAFPEVRLKSFLEMRGADGGPWSRICALPALWVGLLYDDDALDAAWDEVKHWSMSEREALRDAVPRLAKTPAAPAAPPPLTRRKKSVDRALRDPAGSERRRRPQLYWERCGNPAAASPRSSCTAAPAPAAARTIAASSTRSATTSSCSTSAAAAARRLMPRSRPTPPGTSSTTWSACASWRGTNAGWSLAAPGARPWRSLTPRPTGPAPPSWCCAASSPSASRSSTGSTNRAPRKSSPTNGGNSSRRSPKGERGDIVVAYQRRLTGSDRAEQLIAAKAWSKWEAETVTLLPDPHVIEEFTNDEFAIAIARIENHYMAHKAGSTKAS